MVKVTFNSALAQKEAKKDEAKSGEEALIIPPDAVAVDCKVRGPGLGGVGPLGPRESFARPGRLRGARADGGPREGRALPSLGLLPVLVRRSFFVRKCVCRKRCPARDRGLGGSGGGGLENRAKCTVLGAVEECVWGRAGVRSTWRPAATCKTTKQQQEFGTSSQYK